MKENNKISQSKSKNDDEDLYKVVYSWTVICGHKSPQDIKIQFSK